MKENVNSRLSEFVAAFASGYFHDFKKDLALEKKRWFPKANVAELAKERVALDIFNFSHLFSNIFKDNSRGQIVFEKLANTFGETLVKMGFSTTPSEYLRFLSLRLLSYEDDWKNNKEPGPAFWIAKKYCLFLDCSNIEILRQVMISFANSAKTYYEAIQEVKKLYRI